QRRVEGMNNRWFLDAVFKGHYPADIVELMGPVLDGIDLDAVKVAAVPTDFLGINYYTRNTSVWDDTNPIGIGNFRHEGSEYTAMDWEVYPDGLKQLLLQVHREYGPKAIYVTENGAAYDDPPPANGVVEDPQRVAYLQSHFAAAA